MKFKVTLAYDGTQFNGWQKQKNVRTVQAELEAILHKIEQESVPIYASGRTDAKVHALGQVFHFSSNKSLTENDWKRALNGLSDEDIDIKDVTQVEEGFHARYDAKDKTYLYKINTSDYNLFRRHYEYQYNQNIDIKTARKIAKLFIGTHDFSSFNATSHSEIANQIRTINDIHILEEDGLVEIKIVGTGFLRYMVRILVGTIIAAAEGQITDMQIIDLLEKPQKGVLPFKAPAHGLYLIEVSY